MIRRRTREASNPQRQLTPDRVGLKQGEPARQWGIANKAKTHKRHRCRDLYRCLHEGLIYHASIQRLVERLKTKRYRAKFAPKELRP